MSIPASIRELPHPGKYAAAIRRARDYFRVHPNGELKITYGLWMSRSRFDAWVWNALNRRVNDRGGLDGFPGRKADAEYQIRLWRDSRRVRDILARRIIHRQFETDEARRRFGHLLCQE